MNSKDRFAIGATALLILAFFSIYCHGVYLNAVAATCSVYRSKGHDLLRYIEQGQSSGTLWPAETKGKTNYSSSTDFLNVLYKAQGKPRVTDDQNIWTIVKNMPTNAPDNFIVLATRNIDPRSLRLRLTEGDMARTVTFLPESGLKVLKRDAIVFRKDGTSYAVGLPPRFSWTATYRRIYRNQPFDLTTNCASGLPVSYLTPKGEVTPLTD